MTLNDSKTAENLKASFAHEAEANRRYLYFARQADMEGLPDLAGLFRDTAEGEASHAVGFLDYLKTLGDPVTGLPMGDTVSNLQDAIAGETEEFTKGYPEMARTAREEGFEEIARWFELLASAEKNHAARFRHGLSSMR